MKRSLWLRHVLARARAAHARQKDWNRPVGPHCYLHQGRHREPFNKTDRGADRRAARKNKRDLRAALLSPQIELTQEMMQ